MLLPAGIQDDSAASMSTSCRGDEYIRDVVPVFSHLTLWVATHLLLRRGFCCHNERQIMNSEQQQSIDLLPVDA